MSKEQGVCLLFQSLEKYKVHNWSYIQKHVLTCIKIFFDSVWEGMFQLEK